MRMPVLFLGHGSPMMAIEPDATVIDWQALIADVPKPKAILCISAHWDRKGWAVTAGENPPTIHDFYGFPEALHRMVYPASGSPALAQRVSELLKPASVTFEHKRGFDHGAWAPLCQLFPLANIPLVQLSIDTQAPLSEAVAVGEALRPLREDGVLIVGSGNIVHNLQRIDFAGTSAPWAERFDSLVANAIRMRDTKALCDYENLSTDAKLAVPTRDHYDPLLTALGASFPEDSLQFTAERIVYNSLSMRSIRWG